MVREGLSAGGEVLVVRRPAPAARARADGSAAVERAGVVSGHRSVVAAAIGGYRRHPADREAGRVEPPEHGDDVAGDAHVDDEAADVRPRVEAPVREADGAQL